MAILKKKPKENLINLKKVGHVDLDRIQLENQLVETLGESFYRIGSMQTLAYRFLIQFADIRKTLEDTPKSVEKAAQKVLDHLGLPYDVEVYELTEHGEKKIEKKEKEKSAIELFLELVVDIVELPSSKYLHLLPLVTDDLIKINTLIARYEKEDCIKKYLQKDEIPKSTDDRITFEFYKRCLAQRAIILNYQLHGLKDRVRSKCRRDAHLMGLSGDLFRDRPYYFARPYSIHYFDSEKLDLVAHRVMDYSIRDVAQMQKLYYENKFKFYRIYFKKISIEQHFKTIEFYLHYLPLKNKRDIIFKELKRLFKARRWMSFYALALPQIEGLFSEMCNAVSPDENLSQKSLTQKVNKMRGYYFLSNSYFDYFQFYIPKQRNKFAHTGYDEDFKPKCYDLLVDLMQLIKMFCELDNSLVKVRRLLIQRKQEDFISIKDVANYVWLLDDLKKSQHSELLPELTAFGTDFLAPHCDIDFTLRELITDLPVRLDAFIRDMNNRHHSRDSSFDFKHLTKPKIEALMQDSDCLSDLEFGFIYQGDDVEKLEDYHTILMGFEKHLPFVNAEVRKEFRKLQNEHRKTLALIKETKNLLKI